MLKKRVKTGNTSSAFDEIANDPRFRHALKDPKFKKLSEAEKKIKVDDRFKKMFTNKKFQISSNVDKYGRPVETSAENEELKKMYYIDSNSEEENNDDKIEEEPEQVKSSDNVDNISDNEKEEEEKDDNKSVSSSSTEVNEEIIKTLLGDQEYDNSEIQDLWEDNIQESFSYGNSTNRLALVNYEWGSIHAEDIMLLFSSFCNKNGYINSIKVYPSDFGLKRMVIEETEGPGNIWKNLDFEKSKNVKGLKEFWQESVDWVASKQEDNDLDPLKLRRYEKERLKYFYAVIECDSIETADYLYNQLNGKEFELTGCVISLSFIPDDLVLPHKPREICNEIPSYSKVNNNISRALSHSNVRLSWDEDNNRFEHLNYMTDEQLEDIDIKEYLASDSEDIELKSEASDEADKEKTKKKTDSKEATKKEKKKESVRNLNPDFNKKKKKKEVEEEQLEITFDTGLSELSNKIRERYEHKKKTEKETAWEKYQRRRKEIKQERKKTKKNAAIEDHEEEDEFFQDPEIERQQLELLVDKKKKEDFTPNYNDPRFNKLFDHPNFSIDPTSNHYNKKQMEPLMKLQISKRKKERNKQKYD